jgi:hypothetical protein
VSATSPDEPPVQVPPRARARVSAVGIVSFVVCVLFMFAGMAFVLAFAAARIYDAFS